jgi:hypothetical protein
MGRAMDDGQGPNMEMGEGDGDDGSAIPRWAMPTGAYGRIWANHGVMVGEATGHKGAAESECGGGPSR